MTWTKMMSIIPYFIWNDKDKSGHSRTKYAWISQAILELNGFGHVEVSKQSFNHPIQEKGIYILKSIFHQNVFIIKVEITQKLLDQKGC